MLARSIDPALRMPVVVLGSDDVGSAVGHALFTAGWPVVVARDAAVPVLRRAMAFDDALERGEVELAGLRGHAAGDMLDLVRLLERREVVPVTAMPPDDLLCLGLVRGVVDARMRRQGWKADLRCLAGFAIGLGPGFEAGVNVHLAIETAPEATGTILRSGATMAAHGRSEPLGGIGRERFVRAPQTGLWRTSRAPGDPVMAGAVVGSCEGLPVQAPLAGRLRGLVRDGTEVRRAARLLEVDPRGEGAQWTGIAPRPARIAAAVVVAVRELDTAERIAPPAGLSLLQP